MSVIIPIYNLGKYLPRCFESVISQSHDNMEIIMVDDGSTDNSRDVAEKLAASTDTAIVIHQENQGPAIARRTGVLEATGKYVVFLDSDDTLPQDAIEAMVTISERHSLDAFYGLYNRVFPSYTLPSTSRVHEGVIGGDEMTRNILNPSFVYYAGMCFSRRDKWDASMFSDNREIPGEDILTNLRLSLKCNRIGIFNRWVYNYHHMDNSLTTSGRYFKYKYWKNYYIEMREILENSVKLQQFIENVKVMEIDSMAFYVNDIDTSDDWYKQVLKYDVKKYPLKIKVLHALLHTPRLLRWCVKSNRWIKRAIKVGVPLLRVSPKRGN